MNIKLLKKIRKRIKYRFTKEYIIICDTKKERVRYVNLKRSERDRRHDNWFYYFLGTFSNGLSDSYYFAYYRKKSKQLYNEEIKNHDI